MQLDKQKIILDTNVIVSALISNGVPTDILYGIVLRKKAHLCLSVEIYNEYVDVLSREKFSRFKNFLENAATVLKELNNIGYYYETSQKVDVISDESDNKFLELAIESAANYLITGNTQDFNFNAFHQTEIVTPRQYWEIYTAKS